MPLDVSSKHKEPGVLLVSPIGSIDSNTHKLLDDHISVAIAKETPSVIVFDMEGVNYISSMGVRVILRTRKILKQAGGKVLMMNLRPQIKMVFDIIKALPSERIFSSIQELDDYLARMQRRVMEER